MSNQILNTKWTLWYHYDVNLWTAHSFKLLCTITTIDDFWSMVKALQENSCIIIEHLYLMRDGILPMWEDKANRNGGCWSIKVDIKDSFQIFIKIVMYAISETLLLKDKENISNEITGISLCQKNNYKSVLQIWSSNSKNNKITYLHKAIASEYGYEILFRPHIPEFD